MESLLSVSCTGRDSAAQVQGLSHRAGVTIEDHQLHCDTLPGRLLALLPQPDGVRRGGHRDWRPHGQSGGLAVSQGGAGGEAGQHVPHHHSQPRRTLSAPRGKGGHSGHRGLSVVIPHGRSTSHSAQSLEEVRG